VPSTTHPSVWIVIVNWNNYKDTVECLESVYQMDYPNFQVVLVDNGSTGDDLDRLRNKFPQIKSIALSRNCGFALANNVGIRLAVDNSADFIWLLNNDTVVEKDALTVLVEAASNCPQALFFGSWISYYNDPSRLWFGGGRFNYATAKTSHDHLGKLTEEIDTGECISRTDWITGCSLFVRATVAKSFGLLDETFFMYEEDLEWQLRVNGSEGQAVIVHKPLVLHKVSSSIALTGDKVFFKAAFRARNRLKLGKNQGAVRQLCWFLNWLWEFVVKPLLRGDRHRLLGGLVGLKGFIEYPNDAFSFYDMVTGILSRQTR
jgi:GT2 family glycosyltransferase